MYAKDAVREFWDEATRGEVWPRWLLRRIAKPPGLFLLVSGRKHR